MELKNRNFVITGAASGLGEATARTIAAAGGGVLLIDRNGSAVEALAAALGEQAHWADADVTDDDAIAAALDTYVASASGISGLIHCAGVAPAQKVIGRNGVHALEDFSRAVSINLIGAFNLTRLCADHMTRSPPDADGERGVIVLTASVAATDGQIGQAAYAASKGGVVAMTLPIAREFARYGIRVVSIAPGIMETPMLTGMPAEVQASLGESVPFPKRMGKPAEFAALVLSVIGNVYLNGTTIRLDGGIRMAPR